MHLCVQVQILLILGCNVCIHCRRHDDYGVDVAKLAALTQGTELVVLENSVHNKKSYKIEDFFWTGSGDGPIDESENPWNSIDATTVYSTKTILSTIYVNPSTYFNQTNSTIKPCIIDCEKVTPEGDIHPTPAYPMDSEDDLAADRQFWLLTVLKSDGKDPDISELKKSLTNLYRKAFLRQQAKHLGIKPKTKREITPEKPIKVYIHQVDKSPVNGDEKIEVVYHVAVGGQPVDAITAAGDMRLVSDDEVKEELGFPFLVKAEPYIKVVPTQQLAGSKPTWIILLVSILLIVILLSVLACLTVYITKKQSTKGSENRQQVFESGQDNKAYEKTEKGYKSGRRNQNPSPTYINFRSQVSNDTLLNGVNSRRHSRISSSSSSSSFDISPLMGMGKQRTSAKKPIRPKAAINKTTPLMLNKHTSLSPVDTDSSSVANSPDTIFIGNFDPGVVSPKSFLSMPSVKSFPRGNNPEPLNKVLEPVSVVHLDMADDHYYDQQPSDMFPRHGSLGTTDPGIIGPVVWNMHRNRLQHGVSVDEGMDDFKVTNVSKMRKRFHELLDDTFSLFGSRQESPIKDSALGTPIEVKSHSAIDRSSSEAQKERVRPKTTNPKKSNNISLSDPPKGAWMSSTPSPLVRPLSAPFVRPNTAPRVDIDQILAEGRLPANDPAIPLIAAIKKEIGKCSLPGSTTNIRE